MKNLSNVTEIQDIVTKEYVDSKIVGLTEEEYNNLQTKQQGVLYCVYEE